MSLLYNSEYYSKKLFVNFNAGHARGQGLSTKDVTLIEAVAEAMIATTLMIVTVILAIVAIRTVTQTIAEAEVGAAAEAVVILHVLNEKIISNRLSKMTEEKPLLLPY